jgi:catechol 2,3-dioxygenase-like lactoylglutathione lyase family enzyme
MIMISSVQLWVHDQDAALDFYTRKLGMEVRSDVTLAELGGFRWLAVGPVGQADVAISLMAIPGAPVMDAATADQVRGLMAKGFAGTVFLTTDDIHTMHKELVGRGVEFLEEPTEQTYGIEASVRDPSGNHLRIAELRWRP